MKINIFLIILSCNLVFNQNYNNSKIINVPNMEFLPGVFTGLDILIERNFDLIKKKENCSFYKSNCS